MTKTKRASCSTNTSPRTAASRDASGQSTKPSGALVSWQKGVGTRAAQLRCAGSNEVSSPFEEFNSAAGFADQVDTGTAQSVGPSFQPDEKASQRNVLQYRLDGPSPVVERRPDDQLKSERGQARLRGWPAQTGKAKNKPATRLNDAHHPKALCITTIARRAAGWQ